MKAEDLERFRKSFTPPGGSAAENRAICIPSLTGSADAFLALSLGEVVLAVTPGIPHAERLSDDLRSLVTALSDENGATGSERTAAVPRILEFPPLLPDDRNSLGVRLKTIAALKAWSVDPYPLIIIAPFQALAMPIPMVLEPLRIGLKAGTPGDNVFAAVVNKLAQFCYTRLPQVENEGDFSVRGGIIDVWSPGEEFPYRLEFFGDDLESIRSFNPATQISITPLDSIEILPIFSGTDPQNSGTDPQNLGTDPQNLGTDPREKMGTVPMEVSKNSTLFDLLPNSATVLALEHNEYNISSSINNFSSTTFNFVYTGDPAPRGVATFDFVTSPLPGFAELGADEAHHPELFEAARKRLEQHLAAAEKRGDKVLRIDELSGGFEINGFVVVTKADRVFTKKHFRHKAVNAAVQQGLRLNDFEDLEPGEYVVHVDYGVGKYIGSTILVGSDGERREVFTVEYAGGGKLHVPAAHAHLLSRYVGVKGEEVRLHRLDGKRWLQDKKDAQKAVTDLAAALLETQAKREMVPGFRYDTACEGREAFEAAFPYEETADQISAIAAIEKDLGSKKPMDRLICGDAGYGKTEVAMRAAFIAAMNGKQVALLAPTTVLAEQHFETFTSRFDGTPIRIESVSRFQTRTTHEGTFKRLASGACDIVIGTHAILSEKIVFHDLGLIIIDEEQRFGVRHKEFLKRLRATADVLTLSATPIPRTLYLSMTGARDLSLLRSPPRERVAVETRIVRDGDEVIRTAIESELLRGGQVFFLHNRVMTIGAVEKRLKVICPKARIVVAHGQMDSATLARKMRSFERGEYDMLLSTTIIESGIDIPRANTIIVSDAHIFGMADLYQLRGRVGRSSKQGYAYFLLPASGVVDSDARERLDALKRHGGLGSGFNLAVRDLELRGAGNLLGSQQSGHIAAVGFSLYCQLLQRTIALMKGEKVREIIDVKLNLDFVNPRLPGEYIEDEIQRLSLFKRFAEAQDMKTVKALAAEMKDRFGPLPAEARTFVLLAQLRVKCAEARITHIDVTGKRAVFYKAGTAGIAFVRDLVKKTSDQKIRELEQCL